jgi:hypothetical protein
MQSTFRPVTWTVRGLLPEGLTLLAGKPKMGKSWLALELAVAVATGGVALGQIPIVPGEVFYLALEDNERRLHRRLAQVVGEVPALRSLSLATDWARLDQGGEEHIADWLRQHPAARLVIVDTLAKVRPPALQRGPLY